jgi:hypothetical protein
MAKPEAKAAAQYSESDWPKPSTPTNSHGSVVPVADLGEADEDTPSPTVDEHALTKTEQQLQQVIDELRAQREAFAILATDKRVLSQLSDECRAHRERFHEREVLKPIFNLLVGLAVRCQREFASLNAKLSRHVQELPFEAVAAIRLALEARKADLAEFQSGLANYGVQAFSNASRRFDAAKQEIVQRVRTVHREQHGSIAERIAVGYARDGSIIQKERVNVYVFNETNN